MADRALHQAPAMVTIRVDGTTMQVPAASSLAAVLALHGVDALRRSEPSGQFRGVFCGMGSCHDCALTVNGQVGVRSCLTPVQDGMDVETGCGDARQEAP